MAGRTLTRTQSTSPLGEARPSSNERGFLGKASLPDDPRAAALERRGRFWIVVAYVLCPCHLPVSMALLGAAFGGTWLGAAVRGNALEVGVVLGVLYALALWRAFRSIRKAKQIEAAGGRLRCTPDGCEVTTTS